MKLKNIKHKTYSILPKNFQKKAKAIYYDKIIYPIYFLKCKYRYGQGDFFDRISIETTTHCNLRCKFCPNSKHPRGLLDNKKLFDLSLFKKVINELAEINYVGEVSLNFYGEPLTDERLPEMVAYIKKIIPKCSATINTNGFLLTIELYKKLLDVGLDSFGVTQYGEIVPPNTQKVLDYLKANPEVENKIKYRILGEEVLYNRGGEIELKKLPDRPPCQYCPKVLILDYNGDAILCCNDYHSVVKFGNVRGETLTEIWNKPTYKKIRKELNKGIFNLPICKKCVGEE